MLKDAQKRHPLIQPASEQHGLGYTYYQIRKVTGIKKKYTNIQGGEKKAESDFVGEFVLKICNL